MMVKDHTTALNKLQEVSHNPKISISVMICPMMPKRCRQKLSSDTGKQLDKDYMDSMVEDHQKDVQEFTSHFRTPKILT